MSDRKTGSIARLFPERVFGFIYCEADQRDYFFHQTGLENCAFRALETGDEMSFVVREGTKGLQAEEVRFECKHPVKGTETREQAGLPKRSVDPQPGRPRHPRR
jgi:CspA family cold shock protein